MSVKRVAVVPTLFTLANAVCGFGAITLAARVTRVPRALDVAEVEWLWWSGWLVMAAMVFDLLDGKIARLSKSASNFGVQLDSLCDAISFGVAPAFLLLKLCERFPIPQLWGIATLYMACTILRLARFNAQTGLDEESHRWFRGLPSPAAGGAIASLAILRHEIDQPPLTHLQNMLGPSLPLADLIDHFLPAGAVAVALLMVSSLPYPHFANQVLSGRRSFGHIVRVVAGLCAITLVRELALPIAFWAFAASGPVRVAWKRMHTPDRSPSAEPPRS